APTKAWIYFLIFLAIPGGWALPAYAEGEDPKQEIYRYTHEDGSIVFTDDPLKIPEKYRERAVPVELSPLMTIPAPTPVPDPKAPSRLNRFKGWYGALNPWTKITVGGVLPILGLSLWGVYYLSGRTSNPSARLILKLMMALIVATSAYLLYFFLMKTQMEQMTRDLPIKIDTSAPPSQMLEPVKKEEENRLRRIEEIADSP
ncbi:MAG TPA: DUF4124 domain-containing protein, partial [Nitrospiria bacterium]|nr:DUF4124 domain-containing protein [Nitrospiria bacterium]